MLRLPAPRGLCAPSLVLTVFERGLKLVVLTGVGAGGGAGGAGGGCIDPPPPPKHMTHPFVTKLDST